jgi:putative tricarboxylic transport membrane protein
MPRENRFGPRINGPKEVVAGAIFAVIGTTVFFMSQQYEVGRAISMGPGYFPALCGIVLAVLGLASIVSGLRANVLDPIPKHSLEPLVLITLSIVSFGLLIERTGLIVATFVCLFFACFRRVFTHPLEVFLTFVVLTAFNIIVFVHFLQMTMPVVWWRH